MNALHASLRDLGFVPDAAAGCRRRNGLAFFEEPRWAWLELGAAGAPSPEDRLAAHRNQPGLWRWIAGRSGVRRVFEMRAEWFSTSVDGQDFVEASESPTLAEYVAWALATAQDKVPAGWQPPAREQVESWFNKALLTVQAGPCLRQGELIHQPDRLALRFPIHPGVPENLPAPRREWLREVLLDAHDRHYLVRLESDGPAVFAAVDLTGAPHSLLPFLTLAGLTGLRATVSALAETVELLTDTDVASEVLSVPPLMEPPQMKGNTA